MTKHEPLMGQATMDPYLFPSFLMLAWGVSGAQTCFFVSEDRALICWTAFRLVLHAKADQTIAAALQPPLNLVGAAC